MLTSLLLEYDSCHPFVWCVRAFDFAIWLDRDFPFWFFLTVQYFCDFIFFSTSSCGWLRVTTRNYFLISLKFSCSVEHFPNFNFLSKLSISNYSLKLHGCVMKTVGEVDYRKLVPTFINFAEKTELPNLDQNEKKKYQTVP